MLEYVFFDERIRDKFVAQLRSKGVQVSSDELIVEVPEDLDEALADEVDYCYEKLLQETAELMEEGEDALEKNVMGVHVALEDGSACTIRLDPELVARVLNCISMEELRDMAQSIAEGVQNPDNRPLCHT
ncbi:MAG: hypothetical protein OQK94_06890 [Gammaproteobacteria bacterium]|nr:hypothetical protein [Gammaproteobacteria bacterium]MCW8840971.1 hypothetical protein [Gammaproteobacteria bacterium]MCW8927866.1 hypothetical protein [Gammaproteobacteria bacterium]MCW8958728.1 hypothetical protein [Gammaproteobacteria bacterium]MCW8973262.1 hypothetical protein [Gammaproteobacteria bacterium]